ncbi:ABC transporter ATP-binding protein [Phaeovulum sp.]|uniref:ABC transporter ATP-binding protein n=1 Tax=Phaeovulum sp. TaxID=2934796 RepID=UPI00272F6BFE|nr:ABC transporter ATP-binding protein [Phaeovulum sp.]MDP1668624.1 ABC transporter ATP-binding protein [Phaeovulum sp.]MDZ4119887.1 ABC transporter ATP-binding protein [Phaeovulum sp.]
MPETQRRKLLAGLDDRLIWRLLRENMRAQVRNYGIAIAAMVVIAVSTAATAWIMRDVIDSMVESGNRSKVFAVALTVLVIFCLRGAANYVQAVFLSRAGNSVVAAQQRRVYDRILLHGVAFFKDLSSSDLLMRVTFSAQAARRVIDIIVTSFVRDLLTLLGLIVVMIYQQPTLSLFSLLVGPLALYGVRRILKRVRGIMEQEIASLTEIIKVVQETSVGIHVIKAFELEGRMRARMAAAVAQVEKRANGIARLEAATSPLMETLSGFAIAGVVALSAVNLFGDTATTPGQLMSFVTALLMAYEPAKRLARMRVSIEAGMTAVRPMFDILDTPLVLIEAADAAPLPAGPGEVRFRDVSFDYGNGRPVLRGLDINFPAGKTTALVGPSGGGKSTIMGLVMRLHDPSQGAVEVDGQDLRATTFASLRQKISFVGQDTFLFSGTVAHNIALGLPEASEAEVIAAAKAANAHEFIEAMPQGYDTEIGENGGTLSGGQRQRLAIARAILRNSAILLLDEATSALDSQSEALVQDALAHLTEGRTTIVIAHRLSTVVNADKIVVIRDGEAIEQGPPGELLARPGAFRDLYDAQFGHAVRAEG